jgi:hypothetical protein
MKQSTDAELVRLVKIDGSAGEVGVRWWKSGFVVLKRDFWRV